MAKVRHMVRPDEGTTSPYVARVWIGISELRDTILPTSEARRQFDDRYKPIVMALDKTRETAREIRALVADHRRAVSQPGAVELYPNGQITVHIPINETLDRRFDSFTVFAHRAMKLTQHLVKDCRRGRDRVSFSDLAEFHERLRSVAIVSRRSCRLPPRRAPATTR